MALKVEHEMHRRRLGRNVGLGLVLIAFVALVFGLTLVKTKRGDFNTVPPSQAEGSN
ncbi:hypothetical protein RXV86_01815 [Alisedimentitalea sp. MJ-SS2]|uniref:hypothetical protein n=1 Tax=Aliisedimentitalea sp. MJ-SS2 TaxID=3049795 RepID=UPI00290ABC36|nr:hypothetical protein [Alisedimentitalea sp. MJ-SS2]MDU8926114.1 hypothetical protein [Alisedimentitalea sp. MJ-SS2]